MTSYFEHIIKKGERWDTLAYDYYRDATGYLPIMDANPSFQLLPSLPEGKKIYIPVIAESKTLTEDLPPWKQ